MPAGLQRSRASSPRPRRSFAIVRREVIQVTFGGSPADAAVRNNAAALSLNLCPDHDPNAHHFGSRRARPATAHTTNCRGLSNTVATILVVLTGPAFRVVERRGLPRVACR